MPDTEVLSSNNVDDASSTTNGENHQSKFIQFE